MLKGRRGKKTRMKFLVRLLRIEKYRWKREREKEEKRERGVGEENVGIKFIQCQ